MLHGRDHMPWPRATRDRTVGVRSGCGVCRGVAREPGLHEVDHGSGSQRWGAHGARMVVRVWLIECVGRADRAGHDDGGGDPGELHAGTAAHEDPDGTLTDAPSRDATGF